MHSTLKQSTLRPPERNPRRQQAAFDRFQQEFNQQRPHEALDERIQEVFYGPVKLGYLDTWTHRFHRKLSLGLRRRMGMGD
jgi:hypothetical protein